MGFWGFGVSIRHDKAKDLIAFMQNLSSDDFCEMYVDSRSVCVHLGEAPTLVEK